VIVAGGGFETAADRPTAASGRLFALDSAPMARPRQFAWPIQLQLADLDPGDGVLPSVAFLGTRPRGEATASISAPGMTGSESASFTGSFSARSPARW
jgi:hypothetical protein